MTAKPRYIFYCSGAVRIRKLHERTSHRWSWKAGKMEIAAEAEGNRIYCGRYCVFLFKLGATRREISDRSRTQEENLPNSFSSGNQTVACVSLLSSGRLQKKSIGLANYGRKFHGKLLPHRQSVLFFGVIIHGFSCRITLMTFTNFNI
jgi:hypothetical protein